MTLLLKEPSKKEYTTAYHLKKNFGKEVELFIKNPYHPLLRTHKLSGKLKELSSFAIDYDCRVVFYFLTSTKIVLLTSELTMKYINFRILSKG